MCVGRNSVVEDWFAHGATGVLWERADVAVRLELQASTPEEVAHAEKVRPARDAHDRIDALSTREPMPCIRCKRMATTKRRYRPDRKQAKLAGLLPWVEVLAGL